MAEQTTTLDAIVRAELAIEIMNQARGLESERVAAIEAHDPAGAEALRAKRRELLTVQSRIRVPGPHLASGLVLSATFLEHYAFSI